MSKTLQERLGDAKDVFDQVHAALGRHPAGLPQEVETAFRVLVDYRTDIDHWLGMLEARAAARQLLDALETQVDADDCVPLGTARVKYQHVRVMESRRTSQRIGHSRTASLGWSVASCALQRRGGTV